MQPKRPLLWLATFIVLFAAFQYFMKAADTIIESVFQAAVIGIITLFILYGVDKMRGYFSGNHD